MPENGLLKLEVQDKDAGTNVFVFEIMNCTDVFTTDGSGYLYLTRPLDYEEQSTYNCFVSVSDGKFTSHEPARVAVTVLNANDNPPVFESCLRGCCKGEAPPTKARLVVRVDENSVPDTPLANFSACDPDGDAISYTVSGSSAVAVREGGAYLMTPLDYEVSTSLSLTVMAFDGLFNSTNSLQIVVEVNNMDDNQLAFEENPYVAYIDENSDPSTLFLPVKALDADSPLAQVYYSLPPGVPFTLNETEAGTVFVTNTEVFDYEGQQVAFSFQVSADTSEQETALTNVRVYVNDINEFTPTFSQEVYNASVIENTVDLVLVNISASDRDQGSVYGSVSYSIAGDSLHCIVNEHGEVINRRPFDAERNSTMEMPRLLVNVYDGGGFHSAATVQIMVVDKNDNRPQFDPTAYKSSVKEDAPIGTTVAALRVHDLDVSKEFNSVKNFTISQSPKHFPFDVKPSGAIVTSAQLDYESENTNYAFTVVAYDSGGLSTTAPAKVNIQVLNVPDVTPSFTQTVYASSVVENSGFGTAVLQVISHSVDGGSLNYSISEPVPFQINSLSGIITVAGDVDYELEREYDFLVFSNLTNNPSKSSAAQVVVTILNANDHSPHIEAEVYTASVAENKPKGTLRVVVRCFDEDLGNHGLIKEFQFSGASGLFFVSSFNRSDGTAVISNKEPLDYEAASSHMFFIRAVDMGQPPRVSKPATITVSVEDQNDNAPEFLKRSYYTSLYENRVGYVLTVQATDMDHGNLSGQVSGYVFEKESPNFTIHSNGSIYATSALDYEAFPALPQVNLIVRALDGLGLKGSPVVVTVEMLNENDNSPRPLHTKEWPLKKAELEWDRIPSPNPILTLECQDLDTRDQLYFYIDTEELGLPFSIPHLRSGSVILQRSLNELKTYQFDVTVQDRHPVLDPPDTNRLSWTVSIKVVDNNSPPYFSQNQLSQIVNIPSDLATSPHPRTLLYLVATDGDYPGSLFASVVNYTIIAPGMEPALPFEVTRNGELIQTSPLLKLRYAFGVVGIDGGGLFTPDPIVVNVLVHETNDHAPEFWNVPSMVTISNEHPPGSTIVSLNVTDKDTGVSGVTTCYLQQPPTDNDSPFGVHPDNCTLYLTEPLSSNETHFTLTVVAEDGGYSTHTTSVVFTIKVVPAVHQLLELALNDTVVNFTEEGKPVHILNDFHLSKGDDSFVYAATLTLLPNPFQGQFAPPTFENCLRDGNVLQLDLCFPGAEHLLPTANGGSEVDAVQFPLRGKLLTVLRTNDSFLFQTWMRSDSRVQHQHSVVVLSGYSSDSQDALVILVQVSPQQVMLHLPSLSSRDAPVANISVSNVLDTTWHHLTLVFTPRVITVYIDGQNKGSELPSLEEFSLPANMEFLVGSAKTSSSVGLPFSGALWRTSLSFNFPIHSVLASLSCAFSCGESLGIEGEIEGLEVEISSFKLSVKSLNFDTFSESLSNLTYSNIASEPSPHERSLMLEVSDGVSSVTHNLSLITTLINEHLATLDLRMRSDYGYSRGPAPLHLTPGAEFADEDTTQTDYTVDIELLPVTLQSCDRVDYSVRHKLEECAAPASTVIQLTTNYQWGQATAMGVQSYFSSFLGYIFYGSGVLLPDISPYMQNGGGFNPFQFTFVTWVKFTGPGTIVFLTNSDSSFVFHLSVSQSEITITYSTSLSPPSTLTWDWSPGKDWVHLSLVLSAGEYVELCTNSWDCGRTPHNLSSMETLPPSDPITISAYVGARPSGDWYDNRFTGMLSGTSLIPNYKLSFAAMNCLIECSEKFVITGESKQVLDNLPPLSPRSLSGSGMVSMNGSVRIKESFRASQLQDVISRVAYVNTHPYPLSGTRAVTYRVYDGDTELLPAKKARIHVFFHGYRNLQLYQLTDKELDEADVISGTRLFGAVRISTDSRSDKLDSLLIELISTPKSNSLCWTDAESSSSEQCPNLFHPNMELLKNSTLEHIWKPKKLIIHGVASVSVYLTLLREVSMQFDSPDDVFSADGRLRVRVYISDLNGVQSKTKTLTVTKLSSSGPPEKRSSREQFVNTG